MPYLTDNTAHNKACRAMCLRLISMSSEIQDYHISFWASSLLPCKWWREVPPVSSAHLTSGNERNIEVLSPNHCCRGKLISIRYSECVSVALFLQHAKRMRRTILSSAAFLAVQYFLTLSHRRHHFRENLLNINFVF